MGGGSSLPHRRGLQAGEPGADAFEQLVEAYQDKVYALCCRMLGPAEAEDATQDVFLRVFRSLAHFRRQAAVSTWIYQIALNLCRDRLRHRRRRERLALVSLDDPADDEGHRAKEVPDGRRALDDQVQQRELERVLQRALAALSDKHRTVIVLHDLEGLTYQEIAEIVGCSVGTVKSRLFYARAHLRRLLAAYGEGPAGAGGGR